MGILWASILSFMRGEVVHEDEGKDHDDKAAVLKEGVTRRLSEEVKA